MMLFDHTLVIFAFSNTSPRTRRGATFGGYGTWFLTIGKYYKVTYLFLLSLSLSLSLSLLRALSLSLSLSLTHTTKIISRSMPISSLSHPSLS